jgi:osmotically-inducible protein OsmY
MNSNRTEISRRQLADTVKRRWGTLIERQLELGEGKRDRPNQVADSWTTAKVHAEIFNEPSLKVAQINVATTWCSWQFRSSGNPIFNASQETVIMLKRFSAVFIAALMLSALGCATQSEPQSPSAYMGDTWVTTQVKTGILNEPSLKVSQINVETYKGVVQLSGFVDNAASQAKAVEIARAVKGVTSVKNDLRLR